MQCLNEVTLIGHSGGEPKVHTNKFNQRQVFLSVCTSIYWKNKEGEYVEQTQWHNVTIKIDALMDTAIAHVKKGTPIFVRGMLEHYEKEVEGKKTKVSHIVLSRFDAKLIVLEKKDAKEVAKHEKKQDIDLDDTINF